MSIIYALIVWFSLNWLNFMKEKLQLCMATRNYCKQFLTLITDITKRDKLKNDLYLMYSIIFTAVMN